MSVYGTLLGDATRGARGRVAGVVVVGALGATAQGGAIALLVVVMRAIEAGTLDVRSAALLGLAGLFVTLMLVSTGAVYLAAVQSRAIARSWNERSSREVLRRYARTPIVHERLEEHELRQLIMRSPRVMGTAVESIIGAIHPAVYLLICTGVLVHLSWSATLIIAPVALALAPLVRRFGGRVQRDSKSFYEDGIRDIAVTVNRCLGMLSHGNVHLERQAAQAEAAYDADPAVAAFYDGYDRQILANNRSVLITSCLRAVLIGVVLVILGHRAIAGTMSWGEAIVYVVVLAQAASRAETILAIGTSLMRFTPLVRAYQAKGTFPRSGERGTSPFSGPLTRLTAAEIAGPRDDVVFCSERFTYVPGTVLENATGAGDVEDARRLLETLEVPADLWDTALDDETWSALPPRTRAAIRLIALALADAKVAVADARLLRPFGKGTDDRIRAMFATRSKTLVVAGDLITPDAREAASPSAEAEAIAVDP